VPAYTLSTSWGLGHYHNLASFALDAQAWGFEGIEANYGVTLSGLDELRGSGVPVSSLHFPGPLIPQADGSPTYAGPLAPGDPGRRAAAVEHAVRVLEEAAGSGARAVVFHAADLPQLRDLETRLAELCTAGGSEDDRREAREALMDARAPLASPLLQAVSAAIERLLPLAEQHGLRLGLETRSDVRDLPSRDELRELLARFPSAHFGYWHDTGHAYRQELLGCGQAVAWLEEFGDRLVGMHLSDCRGLEDHYAPGQGEINFAPLLAFCGPDTVRTLEIAPRYGSAEVRAGLEHLEALTRSQP